MAASSEPGGLCPVGSFVYFFFSGVLNWTVLCCAMLRRTHHWIIHPIYLPTSSFLGGRGLAVLFSHSLINRLGTPWTDRKPITGLETNNHSHSRLQLPMNLTCMFWVCGEKPNYLRKPTHVWGAQTLPIKKPDRDTILATFSRRGDYMHHCAAHLWTKRKRNKINPCICRLMSRNRQVEKLNLVKDLPKSTGFICNTI